MHNCLKTLYHETIFNDLSPIGELSKLRREFLPVLAFVITIVVAAHHGLIVARGLPPTYGKDAPGIPLPVVPSTGVSPLFGPPLVSTIEFLVDAETKSGDYVRVTNAGGIVSVKGIPLKVVPWNTIYDAKTRTWVVFLANITSDNFRIMYLYLHNGTGAFNLWYYEYDSSSFDGYIFYGTDSVRNKTCVTAPVSTRRLSIVPEAKNPSGISALGPTLFVSDQSGLYINQTESLSLYPLLYRGFPNISELWAILDDHRGRYYYSIFYLFESDREHVLRGHTVRLNDLCQASFDNITAQWMYGVFPFSLTVVSEYSNITAKINGFPFKTDNSGRIQIRVPAGDIQIEAQKESSTGSGMRRVFNDWKWLTKSNPALLRISQNTDLYPTYKTQFYLSISSRFGSPIGEGWYDEGTAAKFSVEPIINLPNSTRLAFSGWAGSQDSRNNNDTIIIDRPKILRANWKRQYEIKVSTKGVPQGVALNVTIDGNQTVASVPFTYRQWVDADSPLGIRIDPDHFVSSNTKYAFVRWQTESGAAVDLPSALKSPIQIVARYETEEPFAGKVTLQTEPTLLVVRDTVTIKGRANPTQASANITLLWSRDSIEWNPIAIVTTDSQGYYEFVWKIQPSEKLYFKARWTYDPDYDPLESSVAVVTRIGSVDSKALPWPTFLRNLVGFLENVSILSQLTSTASNILIKANNAVQQTPIGLLAIAICIGLFFSLTVLIWRRTHRSRSSD